MLAFFLGFVFGNFINFFISLLTIIKLKAVKKTTNSTLQYMMTVSVQFLKSSRTTKMKTPIKIQMTLKAASIKNKKTVIACKTSVM